MSLEASTSCVAGSSSSAIVDPEGDSVMTSEPTDSRDASPVGEGMPAPMPNGPVCNFGSRLCYTYFPAPAPTPEVLNSAGDGGVFWLTIDHQLVRRLCPTQATFSIVLIIS